MYELMPSRDESKLFYRHDNEEAERYGAIGYLRADFGRTGREFWSTWFDLLPRLNTYGFQRELDDVISALRDGGKEPPFAGRGNLEKFCSAMRGKELNGRGSGYSIRTLDYSYYFRCYPRSGDYDVYCFAYDNSRLLSLLE